MKDKSEKVYDMFETKKEPRKTFQTFLRNQVKIQINSFNMIDRKAAIMIRINSTIISAVIIFYSKIQSLPFGNYIGMILIITCFFSLLFALNASRPHIFDFIFSFKRTMKKRELSLEEKIFMPGATFSTPIEEYEKAFNKIVHNQKLQIGNQIRSLHLAEKRIHDSFMHIELSYIVFILGFLSIVGLFIYNNIHTCL